MTQTPKDHELAALLADYAAPVADAGFSDHIIRSVNVELRADARVRRIVLLSAWGLGGIIAGSKTPQILELTSGFWGSASQMISDAFSFLPSALQASEAAVDITPSVLVSSPASVLLTLCAAGAIIWLARELLDGQI